MLFSILYSLRSETYFNAFCTLSLIVGRRSVTTHVSIVMTARHKSPELQLNEYKTDALSHNLVEIVD
jgi:hypothetical protein